MWSKSSKIRHPDIIPFTPNRKYKNRHETISPSHLIHDLPAYKDQYKGISANQLLKYEEMVRKNKSRIVEYALKGLKTKLDMRVKAIKTKEIDYKSLSKIIEETYTRIYCKMTHPGVIHTTKGRRDENRENTPENTPNDEAVDIDLANFLYDFLMRRFENKKLLVDLMMTSIVFSCFLFRGRFPDCEIFYNFLTNHYKPVDLSYFIFVRAVVEKELRVLFFNRSSGKSVETREIFLSKKKLGFVLERIFGFGNSNKITRFFQKMYQLDPSLRYEKNMQVYKFLKIAVLDYYKTRRFGKDYREKDDLQTLLDLTPKNNKAAKRLQLAKEHHRELYGGLQETPSVQNLSGYVPREDTNGNYLDQIIYMGGGVVNELTLTPDITPQKDRRHQRELSVEDSSSSRFHLQPVERGRSREKRSSSKFKDIQKLPKSVQKTIKRIRKLSSHGSVYGQLMDPGRGMGRTEPRSKSKQVKVNNFANFVGDGRLKNRSRSSIRSRSSKLGSRGGSKVSRESIESKKGLMNSRVKEIEIHEFGKDLERSGEERLINVSDAREDSINNNNNHQNGGIGRDHQQVFKTSTFKQIVGTMSPKEHENYNNSKSRSPSKKSKTSHHNKYSDRDQEGSSERDRQRSNQVNWESDTPETAKNGIKSLKSTQLRQGAGSRKGRLRVPRMRDKSSSLSLKKGIPHPHNHLLEPEHQSSSSNGRRSRVGGYHLNQLSQTLQSQSSERNTLSSPRQRISVKNVKNIPFWTMVTNQLKGSISRLVEHLTSDITSDKKPAKLGKIFSINLKKVKEMLKKMISGKLIKMLESIHMEAYQDYHSELQDPEQAKYDSKIRKNKDLNFFKILSKEIERLGKDYHQTPEANLENKVRDLIKLLLSQEVISSEIVRLVSFCTCFFIKDEIIEYVDKAAQAEPLKTLEKA